MTLEKVNHGRVSSYYSIYAQWAMGNANFLAWIGEFMRSSHIESPGPMPENSIERIDRKKQRRNIVDRYVTHMQSMIDYYEQVKHDVQATTNVSTYIAHGVAVWAPLQTTDPKYMNTWQWDTTNNWKPTYRNGEDRNRVYAKNAITQNEAKTLAPWVKYYQSSYDTLVDNSGDTTLHIDQSRPRAWVKEFAQMARSNPDKTYLAFVQYHGGTNWHVWPLSKEDLHTLAKAWPNVVLILFQCNPDAVFDRTEHDGLYQFCDEKNGGKCILEQKDPHDYLYDPQFPATIIKYWLQSSTFGNDLLKRYLLQGKHSLGVAGYKTKTWYSSSPMTGKFRWIGF